MERGASYTLKGGLLFFFELDFMAKHTSIAGFKISTPLAIIGGVVVLAGIIAYPAWQMAKRIYVTNMKARIQQITVFGAQIRLLINIQNKAPVSLPIDSVAGDLTWGPYTLASINSIQVLVIEAGKISELGFDIVVNWESLGTNVATMIKKGNWYQQLNFKGSVTVKGIRVPINQNIQIL